MRGLFGRGIGGPTGEARRACFPGSIDPTRPHDRSILWNPKSQSRTRLYWHPLCKRKMKSSQDRRIGELGRRGKPLSGTTPNRHCHPRSTTTQAPGVQFRPQCRRLLQRSNHESPAPRRIDRTDGPDRAEGRPSEFLPCLGACGAAPNCVDRRYGRPWTTSFVAVRASDSAQPTWARYNFPRLWVRAHRCHSPRTLRSPLVKNCLSPRPCFTWPNTGSTMHFLRP